MKNLKKMKKNSLADTREGGCMCCQFWQDELCWPLLWIWLRSNMIGKSHAGHGWETIHYYSLPYVKWDLIGIDLVNVSKYPCNRGDPYSLQWY